MITRQKAIKDGLRFYTGSPCKKGHLAERYTRNGGCTVCEKLKPVNRKNAAKRQALYRSRLTEDKKALVKQYTKEYLLKNRDIISNKRKKRYLKRRETELALGRAYKAKNKESIDAKVREYHKKNPDLLLEINALRRAAKRNATPRWLTKQHRKEIRSFYKKAKEYGDGYHVDHIIPLQGNNVSGLHVPWNLQVLTALENMRKSNQYANS